MLDTLLLEITHWQLLRNLRKVNNIIFYKKMEEMHGMRRKCKLVKYVD